MWYFERTYLLTPKGARLASRRIRTSALDAGFLHVFWMSTDLSTLLLLSGHKPTQILLTRQRRECQLISACTNSAHQMQADELTLNQQVPGSNPGRPQAEQQVPSRLLKERSGRRDRIGPVADHGLIPCSDGDVDDTPRWDGDRHGTPPYF